MSARTPPYSSKKIDVVACCRSSLQVASFSFVWEIERMTLRTEATGAYLRSAAFDSPDGSTSWEVRLYPRGAKEEVKGDVSVFLHLRRPVNVVINARASISFIRHNGKSAKERSFTEAFPFTTRSGGRGWKTFLSRDALFQRGYLADDTLTIKCDVTVIGETVTKNHSAGSSVPAVKPPLLPDLSYCAKAGERLFNQALHSDVVLVLEGENFPVHKGILAAHSPVFASMFEHEMLENQTGTVHIPDIRPDIMKELLRFIYTGNIEDIDVVQEELFSAAAKYDLQRLKEICEIRLAADLDQENVNRVLVLADLHESAKLKEACLKFVKENPFVMDSQEWAETVGRRAGLLSELCRALAGTSSSSASRKRASSQCNDHEYHSKILKLA